MTLNAQVAERDNAANDMRDALKAWEDAFAEVAKTGVISHTYLAQRRMQIMMLAVEHGLTDAQRQDLWRWMRIISRAAMEALEAVRSA